MEIKHLNEFVNINKMSFGKLQFPNVKLSAIKKGFQSENEKILYAFISIFRKSNF